MTIKTKYNIGDEVWVRDDRIIVCAEINSLRAVMSKRLTHPSVIYEVKDGDRLFEVFEGSVFARDEPLP